MRRNLLFAALLGSTMLTPQRAEAGPVVGWIAGSLGVAAGSALATTAAYGLGASFAGTVIGGFVVKTVVAIGLSALAAQLVPTPSIPSPGARMVNFAQPVAYAEWVYGRSRKGGPLGFTGFSDGKRYYVAILAAHPIEGIVQHWLDERIVTLFSEADPAKSNIAESPIKGYGRITAFTGDPGQQADPGLNAAFAEIAAAHDFKGLSGAVLWAARPPQSSFTQIYPDGRQWAYAPVFDGKKDIYDPRDGLSRFTSNAALVFADWVVNVLGRDVDWAEVADEADASDVVALDSEGIPRKRWEINGTLSDEQEFEAQRAQMAAACDAFVYERADGKVGFTVGRWIEPELTLGPEDFLALELIEGQWGADAPDEVAAVYTEPDNGWRETPSGTWVERQVAMPVRDEPQLFMVTNHNQVSRLNKRLARTKLSQYQLRGTLGMKGYEILGGRSGGRAHRFARVIHPEMGIDIYIEVGELARESVGIFTLTANSVRPEDFDFDAATEEPRRPVYDGVVSDASIPVPTGFAVSAAAAGSATVQWDVQDAAYVMDLQYRTTAVSSAWVLVSAAAGQGALQVSGLLSGAEHEIQIRNRTNGLGVSDWSSSVTFTA
ncbi:fibronectin type III domain-containing protein [Parasedimentitalea psychrophila]|uniref:Fibronectin type III domain-containing protein n=2 Tax=Parasedimentitalea psychrophila TaxID=2997337 RepID=A0A9Y2P2I6_9RHOB|nr:fibronectin type III domain-containing protein [Parasedimentitalea psychrophila]WIY25112.1 fibronectin type III domain-containing protein [Parasedimentitalea psychrophila]